MFTELGVTPSDSTVDPEIIRDEPEEPDDEEDEGEDLYNDNFMDDYREGLYEGSERVWMSEKSKESLSSPSDYVVNLPYGSALEVFPSVRDGVWRVKLVIDTRQLERILSEQVNTEALIEKMRIAAAATSSVSSPTRRRTNIISPWKVPSLFSTSRLPTNNGKLMKSTSAAVESIQLNSC